LQSQAGEIVLLPALPAAWPDGAVRGLCARGGFEVDLRWRGGRLWSVILRSRNGGDVPVRYQERVVHAHVAAGVPFRLRGVDFAGVPAAAEETCHAG